MPGPKHLNEAKKRTYHKTLTLEEISHKHHGTTVFSKLDAKLYPPKERFFGQHMPAASCQIRALEQQGRIQNYIMITKRVQTFHQRKLPKKVKEAREQLARESRDRRQKRKFALQELPEQWKRKKKM